MDGLAQNEASLNSFAKSSTELVKRKKLCERELVFFYWILDNRFVFWRIIGIKIEKIVM